jgi:tight adherence protein B
MASESGNNEFRKFINFAKMSVKYGGNFNKAIAKLKDQGEKLYSLEAIKSANASVGSFVILLMIVINLLLMVNISSDPDIVDIIKSTVTGQVIAVSNAVSIIFGLYMIKNINSSV